MPPAAVCFLMRCRYSPRPNAEVSEEHAFSPVMAKWLATFQQLGIIQQGVSLRSLRHEDNPIVLTDKGDQLVDRICNTSWSDE
jgi:hypothetical protein